MAASVPTTPVATAAQPQRWLFGPLPDLLLGCGLLYVVLFAVFAFAGKGFLSVSPLWVAPLLVLFLSLPHYGATLIRVYEHRHDRRAYALFSVWSTGVVFAAFIGGVYVPVIGSLLLTVYLTWSPWHYTGQNYGLTVMFLRRRGISIPGRWLYASFLSSYALTFAVIHASSMWAGARGLPLAGTGIRFLPLGLPVSDALVAICVAAWALTTCVAIAGLCRETSLRELAPALLLMFTQALWFPIPVAAMHYELFPGVAPLDASTLGAFLVWIAVGHSVQYLWVTSYYARAGNDWSGSLPYLAKTMAAGALVWTLPVLLFAPHALGGPSYGAGLAFLVASAVNIHHFILDGAIWKLRSSRIASVLIRSEETAAETEDESERRNLIGTATWATAACCVVLAFFAFAQENVLFPRAIAAGELSRANGILDGLGWIGRDSAAQRAYLAAQLADRGRHDEALDTYTKSAELHSSARAWLQIAMLRARRDESRKSMLAMERVIEHRPNDVGMLRWAATLSEALGETARAETLRARLASTAIPDAASPEQPTGPARLY